MVVATAIAPHGCRLSSSVRAAVVTQHHTGWHDYYCCCCCCWKQEPVGRSSVGEKEELY